MPSPRRSLQRTACGALAALGVAGALATLASPAWMGRLTGPGVADAASVGALERQVSAGNSKVSNLAGAVQAASSRIAQVDATIAGLQRQIARAQATLDADRAELLRLRTQLNNARARLAQLEAFESRAERVLSKQVVSSYESDRPDIVTVVLESTGFQDLLERVAFAQRIQKQDAQVVSQARSARRAVSAQATRLGALEVHQQQLAIAVLSQRNSLASAQSGLAGQQLALVRLRSAKASQLAGARAHVAQLQIQLAHARAAAAAAAAAADAARRAAQQPAAGGGTPSPAGGSAGGGSNGSRPGAQSRGGSAGGGSSGGGVSSVGGFTFPMPSGAASGPGSWSLDQGVDISAPGGTPELAVCSGTIVQHGIGGFGPWAPVLHCDAPLAGYSYVYYGHAGPANQLPIGTHVGAGQVMSEVGPGIVGISSGPHLEIGFADAGGSPVGTGSAPAMMSLLRAAYGG